MGYLYQIFPLRAQRNRWQRRQKECKNQRHRGHQENEASKSTEQDSDELTETEAQGLQRSAFSLISFGGLLSVWLNGDPDSCASSWTLTSGSHCPGMVYFSILNVFVIVYFKCLDIFSETHFTYFSFWYFYFFEYIIIIFLNRPRKLVQSAILWSYVSFPQGVLCSVVFSVYKSGNCPSKSVHNIT